jgi:predicted acyl esterase
VAGRPQPAWAVTLTGGLDSIADSAAQQLDPGKRYRMTSGVRMADVDRSRAAVWSGAALPAATLVQGRPSLRVTLTTSSPDASVFAYLYDVDAAGSGTLLCSAPYTLSGATPGRPHLVDVQVEPISWTVPAGHHLALVIDTADPRYRSLSAPGSTVTLSSSTAAAATLSVPVGQ